MCDTTECKFTHERKQVQSESEKKDRKSHNAKCEKCDKCGVSTHSTKSCLFTGECNYCHKQGHKEIVCRKKLKDGSTNTNPKPSTSKPQVKFQTKGKQATVEQESEDERVFLDEVDEEE